MSMNKRPVAVDTIPASNRSLLEEAEIERRNFRYQQLENDPKFRFQMAVRDLKAVRAAQMKLGHIHNLEAAFNFAAADIKEKMHHLIDQL